jgi:hypothetical protein
MLAPCPRFFAGLVLRNVWSSISWTGPTVRPLDPEYCVHRSTMVLVLGTRNTIPSTTLMPAIASQNGVFGFYYSYIRDNSKLTHLSI